MELTEKIETINRQLKEAYGIDTADVDGSPIFRVVWCNDQLEKRFGNWVDYDKNNIKIREIEEVREVPKYQNKKDRYVLERRVIVPDLNAKELLTKVSYEPLWFFENFDSGEYLPPKYEMCVFVINNVLEAIHRPKNYPRYVQGQADNLAFLAGKNKHERLKELKNSLFGNETPITDALMAQRGVSYSGLDGKSIIITDGDK